MSDELRAAAAQARAAAAGDEPMRMPRGRPERQPVRARSQLRAEKVTRDGISWYQVEGYASVVERGYEMWDMFGPYTEVVSAGAFDQTLDAKPQVVFRFNHGGMPMASTTNSRLELWADETGLGDRAWLNPQRADVQDLIHAMDDMDVTEQSFMFTITAGQWSPDYSEYRINAVDLDRGDVGPVTYGANPYTSVAARSGEFLADIPSLPPLVAREAYTLLSRRIQIENEMLRLFHPDGGPEDPAARAALEAALGEMALGKEEPIKSQLREGEHVVSAVATQGRSISMIRTRLLVEQGEE
jgi:HK97 family phage prohead protease